MKTWHSTQYPGIRYREHPTRRHRGQADRYYMMRCRIDGTLREEALGWASEGWNPEKAHTILSRIKENIRTGFGPPSLAEMRRAATQEREQEAAVAAQAASQAMTLDAFWTTYYLPRAERTKRSWQTDRNRYRKLISPRFGNCTLSEITTGEIQAFVDDLTDGGAAPATIKQYLALLRQAFNLARAVQIDGHGLFTGPNPTGGVRLPAVHNRRERFLSGAEAAALIAAAKTLRHIDLHDAIVLSLNTGLRLGELQRLSWLDVDFTVAMVTVRDEAMRKPGGKVPLNPAAAELLAERKTNAPDVNGLVFPPFFGANLRENLSHQFKKLVDRVGLNDGLAADDRARRVVFHTLRHTFASWLALAGVDIYRIKTLMRHKTIDMTMRYAHLIPDATREAVHKLAPPD